MFVGDRTTASTSLAGAAAVVVTISSRCASREKSPQRRWISTASGLVISDVIVVRRDVIVRWRHQTRSRSNAPLSRVGFRDRATAAAAAAAWWFRISLGISYLSPCRPVQNLSPRYKRCSSNGCSNSGNVLIRHDFLMLKTKMLFKKTLTNVTTVLETALLQPIT